MQGGRTGILLCKMADDTAHSGMDTSDPWSRIPVNLEPPDRRPVVRKKRGRGRRPPADTPGERRRRRMRLIANVMIIAAVLGLIAIVLYFVGTWLYTSRAQDSLREQLAADNPDLAAAEQTVSESDFITIESWAEGLTNTAAQMAAEAERRVELAALKAEAAKYVEQIRGQVGRPIGRITIPSIGVDTVMVEGNFQGFSESYLRKGPGHWPETALPGLGASVVFSGHRSTYGAPFRKLNELKAGDEIQLIMPYAIIRYTVTQVIVVSPEDVQAVADQGKEQVSLVACHPLYSAKQRIIAQGDMTSFVLLEPAP